MTIAVSFLGLFVVLVSGWYMVMSPYFEGRSHSAEAVATTCLFICGCWIWLMYTCVRYNKPTKTAVADMRAMQAEVTAQKENEVTRAIKDGTIQLIRASWLKEAAADAFCRNQDLPAEALLPPAWAAHLYSNYRCFVLSYVWPPPDEHTTRLPTLQRFFCDIWPRVEEQEAARAQAVKDRIADAPRRLEALKAAKAAERTALLAQHAASAKQLEASLEAEAAEVERKIQEAIKRVDDGIDEPESYGDDRATYSSKIRASFARDMPNADARRREQQLKQQREVWQLEAATIRQIAEEEKRPGIEQEKEARRQRELGGGELAVFWDFGSLPQEIFRDGAVQVRRTEAEAARFGKALRLMPNLYGSPTTTVMQIREAYASAVPPERRYEQRGWCVAEETWSMLAAYWSKRDDKLLLLRREARFEKVPRPRVIPDLGAAEERIRAISSFSAESDKDMVMGLVKEFSAGLEAANTETTDDSKKTKEVQRRKQLEELLRDLDG